MWPTFYVSRSTRLEVEIWLGMRNFVVAGPVIWNSLPAALWTATLSPLTFALRLKAHLFGWLTVCLRTIYDALYKSPRYRLLIKQMSEIEKLRYCIQFVCWMSLLVSGRRLFCDVVRNICFHCYRVSINLPLIHSFENMFPLDFV